VDPVPDPLLLRKSGSAGNRIRTSGFVTMAIGTHLLKEKTNGELSNKRSFWCFVTADSFFAAFFDPEY
jgi:hypothetical protein